MLCMAKKEHHSFIVKHIYIHITYVCVSVYTYDRWCALNIVI